MTAVVAGCLRRSGSRLVLPVLLAAAGMWGAAFDWGSSWPREWVAPIAPAITFAFKWLSREATIGGVEIGEIMRAFAKILEWPMVLLQGLLAKGLAIPEAFGGEARISALPWFAILGSAGLLAHWAGGMRLLLLVVGTGSYLLLFGLWESAMLTLAFVTTTVLAGSVIGVGLGVAAWRYPVIERVLNPSYDLLQVLPIFSYLLPIVVFFGFGPLSGLVATVVFAMPPMARVTALALHKLPQSFHDLAAINGCRGWQRLWLVLLPSARSDLLVGLNQVVNLSFAVAVFAAIIGAGGLGNNLFAALKSLRIGPATEAGLAISLLAIVLDRTCRAIVLKRVVHAEPFGGILERHPYIAAACALLLAGVGLAMLQSELARFPAALTFTTGRWSNDLVTLINSAIGDSVGQGRDLLIIWLLRPVKDLLHALPWSLAVAVTGIVAYFLAGPRLAAIVTFLLLFIVVMGYWAPAMTSLYLALLGALIACAIGFPLGLAGAVYPRLAAANNLLVDLIQTLPPFVYLVPVMMILGIGDVPALGAIAIYAVAPSIRFTQSGLLQVKGSVIEAARMSGCSRIQTLLLVQLPIARRDILLGLNQTVIMAFGMLVITAMVGTRGLEAATLVALGKIDTGEGLLAGLALVALTIVCDRLIAALADQPRHGRIAHGHIRVPSPDAVRD